MAFKFGTVEYLSYESALKLFSYQSTPFQVSSTISAPSSPSQYGVSVAAGGGKIYVGDPGYDSGKGSVFVYDIAGNLIETLTGTYGSSQANGFGKAIAYKDGVLAICATDMVFIYSQYSIFPGPSYLEVVETFNNITKKRITTYDGDSVAIGDGYIAIGDPSYSSGTGRVSIFDYHLRNPDRLISSNAWTITGESGSGFGNSVAIAGQRLLVGESWSTSNSSQRKVGVFDFTKQSRMQIYNPDVNPKFVKIGCARMIIGGPSSIGVYDMFGEHLFTKTATSEGFTSFNSVDIGYGKIAISESSGGVGRVHIYDLSGEFLDREDLGSGNITVSTYGKYVIACRENQSVSLLKVPDTIDNRLQLRSESLNIKVIDNVPHGTDNR